MEGVLHEIATCKALFQKGIGNDGPLVCKFTERLGHRTGWEILSKKGPFNPVESILNMWNILQRQDMHLA